MAVYASSSVTSLTEKSIALRLVGLGGDVIQEPQEVDLLADLVHQGRESEDVAHRLDGLIEPDGALVALLLVVVQGDRALADLLDHGLVGLAGHDLDRVLEPDEVLPLARGDEVERLEHLDRQVVLRQAVDQLEDGLAHDR